MEAHLKAVPSPVSQWWTKLGKWQALMVVVTLGVFFITLSITGDTEKAIIVPVFAAIAVAFATVILSAVIFSAAFIAIFATAFAPVFAAFAAIIVLTTTVVVLTTITITAFVAFAIVVIAFAADKVPDVGKKTIWLSYAAEFTVILLPILGTVLYG